MVCGVVWCMVCGVVWCAVWYSMVCGMVWCSMMCGVVCHMVRGVVWCSICEVFRQRASRQRDICDARNSDAKPLCTVQYNMSVAPGMAHSIQRLSYGLKDPWYEYLEGTENRSMSTCQHWLWTENRSMSTCQHCLWIPPCVCAVGTGAFCEG
jgi:hypothetical protein